MPTSSRSKLLDVVALLESLPEHGLARGRVGTVVEELDPNTALVEFSDDEGKHTRLRPARYPTSSHATTIRCLPSADTTKAETAPRGDFFFLAMPARALPALS